MLMVLLSGCRKTIEKIQQDAIIQAMTDGEWEITSFIRDGTDITADFSPYTFKYYSNKTVDAINNGSVEQTGQWDGNASAKTTWANFTSAVHPILLINGTWNITNNSWTYVEAAQTAGGHTSLMRLDKR